MSQVEGAVQVYTRDTIELNLLKDLHEAQLVALSAQNVVENLTNQRNMILDQYESYKKMFRKVRSKLTEAQILCTKRRHPLARRCMNEQPSNRKRRYCSICNVVIYLYKKHN